LQSILQQSILPNEIIIADDGSKDNTGKLINDFKHLFSIPLIHVWQEDDGFRLSKIRNKAIAKSNYEYIIQIDGDVILNKYFIQDHLFFAQKKALLQGSRVMLGNLISQQLIQNTTIDFSLINKDIKRKENGIRFYLLTKIFLHRYRLPSKKPKYFARGANMSFWKSDFILVNGYNEKFEGWGHEDSDLTIRLMNIGVEKLYFKFAGIIYHLYHKEEKTKNEDMANKNLLRSAYSDRTTKIETGINQYI
jgi:glycosyltransferase involved in cell wall biosynthesis